MKRGKSRVVTFTTDFGTGDPYAAVMKGVALAINHRIQPVDISHAVAPQHIEEAAYLIGTSWHWFPAGSIHVVVVDPGVGTDRRALAVQAGGHMFVGPDNGVFSHIFFRDDRRVFNITNKKYLLPSISRTFHGRDIFTPAAAWLSRGVKAERMGPEITDYIVLPDDEPEVRGRTVTARVVHTDRFGNLITNVTAGFLREAMPRFSLKLGKITIRTLQTTYDGGAPGKPMALVGSTGRLEIAVPGGSAAQLLRKKSGSRLRFTLPA